MISHQRRFVFIHIPRTGGTSLNDALRDESCELLEMTHDPRAAHAPANHLTLHEIASHGLVDRERLRSYFKFCFVRNPWDRLISSISCRWIRSLFEGLDMKQSLHKACGIAKRPTGYGNHLRPQSDFLSSGDLEMDFIGRFEDLQQDFERVCEKVGLRATLPCRNKSRHRPYWTYYDRETRDLVAEIYREDVEGFGYTFAGDGVFRRNPGFDAVARDGRWLLTSPDGERAVALNATAGVVFQLIDGRRSLTDIRKLLEDAYPESGANVAGDVERIVGDLFDRGIIHRSLDPLAKRGFGQAIRRRSPEDFWW